MQAVGGERRRLHLAQHSRWLVKVSYLALSSSSPSTVTQLDFYSAHTVCVLTCKWPDSEPLAQTSLRLHKSIIKHDQRALNHSLGYTASFLPTAKKVSNAISEGPNKIINTCSMGAHWIGGWSVLGSACTFTCCPTFAAKCGHLHWPPFKLSKFTELTRPVKMGLWKPTLRKSSWVLSARL
jgi:hypothetical protein